METNLYFTNQIWNFNERLKGLLKKSASLKKALLFTALTIMTVDFSRGATINVSSATPSTGCSATTTSVSIVYTKTGSFSGNTFTAQLSNSSGSFASPTNIGSIVSNNSGTISATIPSGLAAGAGYLIRVVGNNPVTTSSNTVGFTITAAVTPSVSIALTSGSNPTCSGSSVTFTASPTNGGTTPSYQWKVAGVNAGTNSATFTTSSITNGQAVTCVLTSNATCVTAATAASNSIIMTVTATPATPAPTSNGPICANTTLSLTTSNVPGASFSWTGPNGFTSSTRNSNISNATTAATGTYSVTVTDNGCTSAAGTVAVVVNATVTPSVTIAITSGSNPSCAGSSVTFTASPVNGGTTPAYQWKVNGVNAGTNSSSFTSSSITTGQSITCVLTSNATCPSPATATSNAITMTINPLVTPSVSIAQTSGTNPTCAGTSVTFTASPVNGGTTPAYQWQVNGVNAGTNSSTFTTSSLTNGQDVTCILTSNATCASPSTATSNSVTVTINPLVTPSVSIAQTSGTNPTCAGTSVTFTANPVNGGTTPAYQWQVNGANAGANSSTFTTSSLTNGQDVTCILTSNATCASPSTATSNSVTMTIDPLVTPSVSIAQTSGTNPACAGTSATFAASPVNSGTTPAYQWQVNGLNAGTNSSTFTTSSLTNGQDVTCIVTSNATCASPSTATSNSVTMTIDPIPNVTANTTATSICLGGSVTLTGGGATSYSWSSGVSNGVSFSPSSTQTYTVTGTSNGCSGSSTVTVTVTNCVPSTRLDNTSCGQTGLSISSYIYCFTVSGATDYEFTLSNSSLGYSQTKTNATTARIRLNSFTGLLYGQTYDVSVKAKVGGVWGPGGTICPISLMPFPSTGLTATSCGATNLSPSSYISCTLIAGASNYEFSISNSTLGYSVIRYNGMSNSFIQLAYFPGLMYGETYNVSVRANVSGVWSPVGPVCSITLMPPPPTTLNATSCGATNLTMLDNIFCNSVSGATNYEFTISNSSLGYSYIKDNGGSVAWIRLNQFPGLMYDETYEVTIRAKTGGVWGPSGAPCQITLGSFPTTTLNSTSCGATGLASNSYIYINGISGATDYEYTISNSTLGYSQVVYKGGNYPDIGLDRFTGLLNGPSYDVTVKAFVGGVWGPAGSACQISLGTQAIAPTAETNRSFSSIVNSENETSIEPGNTVKVYPNPVDRKSILKIESSDLLQKTFLITDITGRIVFEKRCGGTNKTEIALSELNLDSGIYNLTIISETDSSYHKIIITK